MSQEYVCYNYYYFNLVPFFLFLLTLLLECHSFALCMICFVVIKSFHSLLVLFGNNFLYAINLWQAHSSKKFKNPLIRRAFVLDEVRHVALTKTHVS